MTENHSESTEKKERTEIFSPGGVDYDHYIIFEQVLYHGGPAYARSDEPAVFERTILPGKDDPSLDKSTKPFRVLDGELPWKPASEPESYRDEASLFKDVREFLDRFIDFKDPRLYDIVAAWIMTTWRIEDWRVAGPLYLLGPINSGKTVCLECLEELAYRAVRSGSMSTAVMFRLSDSFHPTILVDEAQIYNKEEWGEIQALINESYRKGGKVWRMEGEGRNMLPRGFRCYGPRAFASNKPPWPALTSRAILVKMEKNVRDVKQTLTPFFFWEAGRIQSQLLTYRFRKVQMGYDFKTRNFDEPPDEIEILLNSRIKDYRTREVGYPLLSVAPDGEPRKNILSYLQDLEADHQAEEETGYLADYVEALSKCQPVGQKVTVIDVQAQLKIVLGIEKDGKVPHPRAVMAALKTLGFKKTRVTGGRTGIYWDAELLDRLKERFGPPPVLQNASLPSLSSLHEETIPSQSEDSEDGEDISGAPSPPASSPVIAEISRLRILILQKVLPDLEARIGYGTIPQMVYSCQYELGVDLSAELVEGVVKSLEKEGVIFTPSRGCYRRTTSGPRRTETA